MNFGLFKVSYCNDFQVSDIVFPSACNSSYMDISTYYFYRDTHTDASTHARTPVALPYTITSSVNHNDVDTFYALLIM